MEALEELFGVSAAASRCVSEQHDRRAGAAMPSIIGGDGPEEALLRSSSPGIEHRGGGFVHKQAVGLGQMLSHVVGDRLKMEAGPAGPVAEGGPVELDPLPGVDAGLSVEGHVVAELRDDDLGDQRLGRQAAGHDMFGRMRLHDRARTAPAGVFRTPGDEHAELCGDHVETLGGVFADLRHLATSAGA